MTSGQGINVSAEQRALSGEIFGHYRILRPLQRGGMGEVLLAESLDGLHRGTKVVLKRLLPALVGESSFDAMFANEARLMSMLHHPNIVRVLDQPVVLGQRCLALELVHGRNLYQVLRRLREQRQQCPPQVALHIITRVLAGLEHAHRATDAQGEPLGIIHRDVTPGNILLSFDGAVKVTDFGIAKSAANEITTSAGLVKGTTRYLSPEQVRGWPLTPRADVYAATVVLAEMLLGAPLFNAPGVASTLFQIVQGERPSMHQALPIYAPRLASVMERALSVLPEDRPESAAELSQALEAEARSLGATIGEPELGAFVRRLFFDNADVSRFETHFGDALDLTYLVEFDEDRASSEDRVSAKILAEARAALLADEDEDVPESARTASMRPPPAPAPPPLPLPSFTPRPAAVLRRTIPIEGADIQASRTDPPILLEEVVAEAPRRRSGLVFALGLLLGALVVSLVWLGRPGPKIEPMVLTAAADPEPPPPSVAAPPPESPLPSPSEAAASVAPSPPRPAKLVVRGPRGARIKIDGVLQRARAPVLSLPLEPGRRSITLVRGRSERTIVVEVPPGSTVDVSRDPVLVAGEPDLP
ncbi:MAG: serine/threonine-protein kinase [Myxococcota bacterium]